jgi:hypothetical protein
MPRNTFLSLGALMMAAIHGCSSPNQNPDDQGNWFETARWNHRLLVVSGPTSVINDQIAAGKAAETGYLDRQILLIDAGSKFARLVVGNAGPLPDAAIFRSRYGMPDNTFQVVLVGKDGRVKERRNEVFPTAELFDIIDAMPMRMREMREDLDTD